MRAVTDEVVRAERVDYAAMVDAIDAAGDAFIGLLCRLGSGDGLRPVPQLDWNVGETAAHMLTIVRRGLGDRRRSESIPGLATLNAECIAEVEEQAPLAVADALAEDKARLLGILRLQTAEEGYEREFPLHAGLRANVSTALSYMLFDFMAHGLDIARAVGSDWVIEADHAALGLHACLPALGPWAKSEVVEGERQTVAIGFPGDPTATIVEVGGGAYAAHNVAREAAADLDEVDPVETFLALAGRAPSTTATVARLADWFEPI